MESKINFKPSLDILKFLLISLGLWIFLPPQIILALVFRNIVDVLLHIIYKNKYGGLFDKSDVAFLSSENPACNLTTVMYVKCAEPKDVLGHVKRILQEKVFDHPNQYPKLTARMRVFGGYPYWLKNEVKVDEAVKMLEVPPNCDEEHLKEAVDGISGQKLPENGLLWSFNVGAVPLVTQQEDGFVRYPIVTCIHHSIGDGTALVALFLKLFGDGSSKNYGEDIFGSLNPSSNAPKKNFTTLAADFLRKSSLMLQLVFVSFGRFVYTNTLKSPDENALKPKIFSGKKHVVWATETQPQLVDMIKHIKTKENSRFICVCFTAIMAGITKFFKEVISTPSSHQVLNSQGIPESLTGVYTVLTTMRKTDSSLDNITTGTIVNLPTTTQFPNLRSALRSVTQSMSDQITYADILIVKILMDLMGNLPLNLMRHYVGLKNITLVFSNIPGGSRLHILDGCDLEMVVPVVPLVHGIGISFAMVTYDDRVQIGMAVDQELLSKEKAQQIVDDVFLNIKLLYDECEK